MRGTSAGLRLLVLACALLAGCGNFSMVGILDTPPAGGPSTLKLIPVAVSVPVNGVGRFTAAGGSGGYTYSVMTGGVGGAITAEGLYTAPALPGTDSVAVKDSTGAVCKATATVVSLLLLVPDTASVQVGGTYTFDASGGFPPYAYSVAAGTGVIDPATGLFTAPGAAESDTVRVTDSLNNVSTATALITPISSWMIQSIDTASRSGQYASMALSGAGVPQIAYYESRRLELRLEKWNGSAWTRQTVDTTGTVGQYASLALDAAGHAQVSYYDATNKRLRYASWNGSAWSIQTVDSGGDLGKYDSLALDGSGRPKISYYDATNRILKYASWNGTSWTKQIVDSAADVGMYSSLALDAGGNPHVSYYDNTNKHLKYASWNGTGWAVQTVDNAGDVGSYSSLALDPAGNPRVSYYDGTGKALKYVAGTGTSWGTPQTIDSGNDVGTYSSLALDSGGNPHISYYDNTNRHLKYISWYGSAWGVPQTADPANNVGMYSSIRCDPATGKVRIAYYNSSSMDLKYAKEL